MNSRNRSVTVIGGGLGGLSAAISLATEGFAVTLYEKNAHLGGKLNVLQKDGFTFDLGPSILTLPHIFQSLFTRAGRKMEDYVTLQNVQPQWRNFFEDGTVFDLTSDMQLMETELAKLGPGAAKGFYQFVEYSRSLYETTSKGYFAKGLDGFIELLRFYGMKSGFSSFDPLRNVDGGVGKFVKDPKLRDVLNYFIKYVGSSPYDAPALLNLIPYVQFGFGVWYVRGGMHALADALERLALELGVSLQQGREVLQLKAGPQRVVQAVLSDGTIVETDLVISNMEVTPTYEKLLGEKPKFLKTLAKFAPSCSGYVMHLGVNRTYPRLAHHNVFYSASARQHFDSVFHKGELSEDPTLYLVAPCKTDPAQAPAGCEVIKVLPHIPHLQGDQRWGPAEYAAFRNRVLEKLERMGLADLRKHIVCEDTLTPEDIAQRYYSNRGSIYGVVSDRFKNLGFKAPQRSRRYANLYFVGGSVNPGAGMPMVVLSGQLVRDKILADLAAA